MLVLIQVLSLRSSRQAHAKKLNLKKELDLPQNYGKNWDALWDCLTDMVDVEEPLYIEILGAEVIEQKWPKTIDTLVEILKDLKHWRNDHFCNCVKIEIVYGDARYEIN